MGEPLNEYNNMFYFVPFVEKKGFGIMMA